jgi:hypothetical protein
MSRKRKRIAIVGSSRFPITPELGAEVVDLMRAYPDGTVFLTRGGGVFDTFVASVGPAIGYAVLTYPSPGGSANWDRDVALVKDADEVMAFLDPETLHDTNTGTAHVIEKALDQKKKVMAYSVANRHLVYAGSSE